MKLIVAIVHDYDAAALLRGLVDGGFRATRIGGTGGFLQTGNVAMLIGVEDHLVAGVLSLVSATCQERTEEVHPGVVRDMEEWMPPRSVQVSVGGADVFIMNVARFERI